MFKITALPAFTDNYIWAIHNHQHAIVVDPGEASPVLAFLAAEQLELTGILCTHRHADHIGGIAKLRGLYNAPVYGRRHLANPYISHDLREGDTLDLSEFGVTFNILEIPGHLDDHVAFYNDEILFCGDVLFGAGCGRNKEGTLAQLHDSLQRLSQLPAQTQVYCAHEYTAANLRFAAACEPNNADIQQRVLATQQLRAAHLPSLPSTIALELKTNPFLRCTQTKLIQTLQQQGLSDTSALAVFIALREWRNHF
ncbi:MAG: hydroxyacylglutathione hydrolase [Gallionella sp.]